MNYYTPRNPNHALLTVRKKHPVRHALRITGIVILTVLLVLSLTLTLCVAGVRTQITPEYVYTYADGIDYIDFPLPINGSFATISQLMQDSFGEVGFPLSGDDVEILFDQFSIPTILAGFAQDVTAWLLHDGSRPVLVPEEIAAIALSGVEESILQILRFLGDPVALVSSILVTPLSTLDTEGMFDAVEPVRALLSADMLAMAVSVCLMLAVLVFMLCLCSAGRFCLPGGIALFGTGVLLSVPGLFAPAGIRILTVVYAEYLTDFLRPVVQYWQRGAFVCCFAGIILILFWLLRFLILKNKAVPPEMPSGWENGMQDRKQFIPPEAMPDSARKKTENRDLYTEE